MRSWRELLILAAAAALASCGDRDEPEPEACPPDSPLDWTSFGEPFMRSWCTGCHSSTLGPDDRQSAPEGFDFDTLEGVRAHAERIRVRALDQRTMPPAGGPSGADLRRLDEWLTCGAPGEDAPDPPNGEDTAAPVGCDRVGRWVLSGATCGGADYTATWLAMFPATELVVTDAGDTCAIEYRLADAGCDERQAWRSDLEAPASEFEFLGTTSCEPVACAWQAVPDDVCQVLAAPDTQQVPVVDLPGGGMGMGPLAPPDLASFCTSLGLVFVQVE